MGKSTFVDGDPSQNILGTIITAALMNALNNHRHDGLDIDGHGALDYAASTGSANAYAIALSPPLLAYIPGMPIIFKANIANTSASSLNINGLGAKYIKKNINQDLEAGDIKDGQLCLVVYDGINLILLNNQLGSSTQYWYAADGVSGKQSVNFSQFGSGNGYQTFPGGFIIQWGTASVLSTGTGILFPITFPTACYGVYAVDGGFIAGQTFGATSITLNGFTGWNNTGAEGMRYLAIGR